MQQQSNSVAILSSAYFPPVQWMQKLHRYSHVFIERNDNFCKQTYRNRCLIATANGVQALTVPIEKYDGAKCAMRDIRVSDHGEWRHLHWNAIVSAYGESPFFDYYADDLRPFFERKWEFLFDFNTEITMKLCELLDVRPDISLTDEYADAGAPGTDVPSTRGPTLRSSRAPTIRFTPGATVSSQTCLCSTCCATRGRRVYSIYKITPHPHKGTSLPSTFGEVLGVGLLSHYHVIRF